MKGQWIGRTVGANAGEIIINIDDLGKYYSGIAYIFPDDKKLPMSAASFRTDDKSKKFTFKASIEPIKPMTGIVCTWEEFMELYPGITLSRGADVSGTFEENDLHMNVRTNLGIEAEINLTKKIFSAPSEIRSETKSWEEYKKHVSSLSERKLIFRGQQKAWKLRTAFHRRGRYDLRRFMLEDKYRLLQHLSSRISHVFNLNEPNELGAFISLVQHHGYPTPLLDWTFSPYIAAFFAFRNLPKSAESDDFVRVLIFDQDRWMAEWYQPDVRIVDTAYPYLSIHQFLAIENERLIPQQSITTATNIDDIETFVHKKEIEKKCKYLDAIDIPSSERNNVIKELSFMGITAGSMFPGIEGACEELREKLFDE